MQINLTKYIAYHYLTRSQIITNITMDGDHTAKAFDAGANSATKGATDFTESIHEGAHQPVRAMAG